MAFIEARAILLKVKEWYPDLLEESWPDWSEMLSSGRVEKERLRTKVKDSQHSVPALFGSKKSNRPRTKEHRLDPKYSLIMQKVVVALELAKTEDATSTAVNSGVLVSPLLKELEEKVKEHEEELRNMARMRAELQQHDRPASAGGEELNQLHSRQLQAVLDDNSTVPPPPKLSLPEHGNPFASIHEYSRPISSFGIN
eukprot:4233621-Amphidinium_carterae.1